MSHPGRSFRAGHAEVLADRSQRPTRLVHVSGDGDVVVAQDAIPRLNAGAAQDAECGRSIDAELGCQ